MPKKPAASPLYLAAFFLRGYGRIEIIEDPAARLAQLQEGSPWPIMLVTKWKFNEVAALTARADMSRFLVKLHRDGWFQASPSALNEVAMGLGLQHAETAMQRPPRRKTVGSSRPVRTPDGAFPSAAAAAEHYGISRQAAHIRASKGTFNWRFED